MNELYQDNCGLLYHEAAACKERGGNKSREYGFPVKCVQHWSDGYGEYQCPACGRVWDIPDEEARNDH
jgi:hypothetical protein